MPDIQLIPLGQIDKGTSYSINLSSINRPFYRAEIISYSIYTEFGEIGGEVKNLLSLRKNLKSNTWPRTIFETNYSPIDSDKEIYPGSLWRVNQAKNDRSAATLLLITSVTDNEIRAIFHQGYQTNEITLQRDGEKLFCTGLETRAHGSRISRVPATDWTGKMKKNKITIERTYPVNKIVKGRIVGSTEFKEKYSFRRLPPKVQVK